MEVHEVSVFRIYAAHDVIEGGSFSILGILGLPGDAEKVVRELDKVIGAASLAGLSIEFLSDMVRR